MTTKQKLMIPVAGLAVAGGVALATQHAYAASPTTVPPIVQKLADTFHLNVNDVQAVFKQSLQDRLAKMETSYETRLTQLVTDGKITSTQKDLILSKHKELDANRSTFMASLKTMTADQRKAALQQQQTDLKTWATTNNIDVKYLMGGFGMGMRERGHWGGMKKPSPTATP